MVWLWSSVVPLCMIGWRGRIRIVHRVHRRGALVGALQDSLKFPRSASLISTMQEGVSMISGEATRAVVAKHRFMAAKDMVLKRTLLERMWCNAYLKLKSLRALIQWLMNSRLGKSTVLGSK